MQQIFMENMFDEEPDMLAQIAEKMQDEERFGVCFDYAHAQVFGDNIDDWMLQFGRFVKHMHINDNDLKNDLTLKPLPIVPAVNVSILNRFLQLP